MTFSVPLHAQSTTRVRDARGGSLLLQDARVIDVVVRLPLEVRPHQRSDVPHAVRTLGVEQRSARWCERRWDSASDRERAELRAHTSQAASTSAGLVRSPWVYTMRGIVQRVRRLGRNVEGDDPLGSPLHQHLHQPLAHKPAATGHDAAGRYGREGCLLGRHGCERLREGPKTGRAHFPTAFLLGSRRDTRLEMTATPLCASCTTSTSRRVLSGLLSRLGTVSTQVLTRSLLAGRRPSAWATWPDQPSSCRR